MKNNKIINEKQLYGIRKFKKITGSALLGVITIFGVAVTTGLSPQGDLMGISFGTITVHAADVSSGVTVSDLNVKFGSSSTPNNTNEVDTSFKISSKTGGNKGDTFTIKTHDFRFNKLNPGDIIKDSSGKQIAKVNSVTRDLSENKTGYSAESVVVFELLDNLSNFEATVNSSATVDFVFYVSNTPPNTAKSLYVVSGSSKTKTIDYDKSEWKLHQSFSSRTDLTFTDSGVTANIPIWLREHYDNSTGKDLGIKADDVVITPPDGVEFDTSKIKVGDTIDSFDYLKINDAGRVKENHDEKHKATIKSVEGKKIVLSIPEIKAGDDKYTWFHTNFPAIITDSSSIVKNKKVGTTHVESKANNEKSDSPGSVFLNYLSGSGEIKTVPTKVIYKDGDKTIKEVPKGNKVPGEKLDVDGDEDVPNGYKPKTPNSKPSVPADGNVIVPVVANKSNVTVNHKDESGKVLKTTSSEGNIGDEYKTSPEKIDGYTLVKTPENASGKYVSGGTTVEYIYHQNVTTYVDENGKPITPDQAKDGKSYTHVNDEPQKNGDTKKVYHKVVTNFVDESGKKIMDPKDGTVEKSNIDGYTFVKTDVAKNGDVTHTYHHNVTTYVDENGTPITPDKAKDGKSYTHVKDEPQKNGDTKKVYHKIVTNFVDESGKKIMDPKDGTVEKSNVDGYTFVKTDVAKNGDVTHTYHKIVTKFIDESKKQIGDPKDGVVDKIDIPGYSYVKTEKDDKGDQIHIYKAETKPAATKPIAKQDSKKASVDTGAEVAGSIGQIVASIGAAAGAAGAYFKFGRKKK